ncbi:hypothetical protein CLOTH_14440 [Alkalithermobacter paradoxus]|uniref:DUF1722 domain-containing protein n=1 Tax=Alkalithermobacter paradoxus TaxID=29349 RepID=A0A1V4I5Y9_9FIRM|nr:hypothetical protein CLOTH_14440 [[Clostridium] thermoalcaliphilum]
MINNKPNVVVSKCLGFDNCRYNGQKIQDNFINKLSNHVNFIPVCPEVEIGLSTPRSPIRIVKSKENVRLIQPSTNIDLTEKMNGFSQNYINEISEADGFIFKSKSPSCGIKDVKIYSEESSLASKGIGMFASQVINKYPHLPLEDEGRLKNFSIRENFLTKLFGLSNFKNIYKSKSLESLIEYHRNNHLLFLSIDQSRFSDLDKIIYSRDIPKDKIFDKYKNTLYKLFERSRTKASNINTLKYSIEYILKDITSKERSFFILL